MSDDAVRRSQQESAALYGVSVPIVNEHLAVVFGTGELESERTIRKFRMVQVKGAHAVLAREMNA